MMNHVALSPEESLFISIKQVIDVMMIDLKIRMESSKNLFEIVRQVFCSK